MTLTKKPSHTSHNSDFIRIAHRGASGIAPENTLTAFKTAIEIGVDAIELDLHGTANNQIVVIHDPTLDRTTNLDGLIKQMTLNKIKHADAGSWFDKKFEGEPIPTLSEVLAFAADKTISVLEIKDTTIAKRVVEIVCEMDVLNRVIIISFDISSIETVRSIEPKISTGLLIGGRNGSVCPIRLCQKVCLLGSNILNVHHQLITPEFAYEVRRRGVTLWCWTVDDIERIRELISYGVQGITSNYPEIFGKV